MSISAIIILSILILNYIVFILASITNTDPFDWYDNRRWKSFISYLAKKWLVYSGEIKVGEEARVLTKSELIQYGYRFAKCYECIIKGQCINCSCDAVGKVNNKTDFCSLEKFGIFLEDVELEDLIKQGVFNTLKITVEEE